MTEQERAAIMDRAHAIAIATPRTFSDIDPVGFQLNDEDYWGRLLAAIDEMGHDRAEVMPDHYVLCSSCGAYIPYHVRYSNEHPGLCSSCGQADDNPCKTCANRADPTCAACADCPEQWAPITH